MTSIKTQNPVHAPNNLPGVEPNKSAKAKNAENHQSKSDVHGMTDKLESVRHIGTPSSTVTGLTGQGEPTQCSAFMNRYEMLTKAVREKARELKLEHEKPTVDENRRQELLAELWELADSQRAMLDEVSYVSEMSDVTRLEIDKSLARTDSEREKIDNALRQASKELEEKIACASDAFHEMVSI